MESCSESYPFYSFIRSKFKLNLEGGVTLDCIYMTLMAFKFKVNMYHF